MLIKVEQQAINIFNYTDQKLKAHIQNNQDFKNELDTAFDYYRTVFMAKIKDSDRARFEKELTDSVNGQVFNGYFIIQEAFNSEGTEITDEWFQQSKGSLAQQMPDTLRDLSGNNLEEVITHEPLKKLSSWLVVEYEDVYHTLMDLSINAACVGAKWALYDEAEKRGIQLSSPQYNGLLAPLDDITFINPQHYISVAVMNDKSEVWEIVNSKYTGLEKMGEVNILEYVANEGTTAYFMNINISNSLPEEQQQEIIYTLSSEFMQRNNVQRAQMSITVALVSDFLMFG